ncbi:MAG: acyl-CoA carboxylase subunit beta [Rhodobacteraceae bacterium]|nr:acyl-CoA carboxylase subunit beta [Paracoccaceae bacterium]
MPVFKSRLSTASDSFTENRAAMLRLISQLTDLNERGALASEMRRDRFHKRGQLTPRERLSRLLDPGLPWLTIGNMSGYLNDGRPEEKSIPGSTNIAGIGYVNGTRCAVLVDDSGVMAGALTRAALPKIIRIMQIALEQKLPFVHLVESAGGDLLDYRVESFVQGGEMFAMQARLSKAGLPVITVLHGSSTAGGAYMPGMSDYVIGVRGNGKAFLAGPPLLKAATGEIAKDEDLGGVDMHASRTGLIEYVAENDADALLTARSIVGRLGWNRRCPSPMAKTYEPPHYDPDEIAGLVPVDYRTPYDARELVARIVDGSDFDDFKPSFGVSMLCLQAQVMGQNCAFLGNNGPIDPDGATKAAQFLQLMDQADIPVIFLQNITGYMVGAQYEQAGMIKHGSKMIQAVTNIEVPRLTVNVGASFGAGNYGMCGQGFGPDFLFSWPNAATGVMGGEQAAQVMSIVAESAAARSGQEPDPEMLAKQEAKLKGLYDSQSGAFVTSGRNLDDGIIDPRDTRKLLGFLLATVWEARNREVRPNSFGIARM